MRNIVYLRISTDKQDVESQKFNTEKFCKQRDLEVTEWIVDIVSGAKDVKKRRLWSELQRLESGDTLVVSELSRIGRNLFDIFRVLQYALDKEIKIYTVKEGYVLGKDIQSKVIAFAFGIAAELEHEMISLRTREGLARKKAEGVILGRPIGSKNRDFLLKKHEVDIIEKIKNGATQVSISREYKVHRHTVKLFCKERNLQLKNLK